METLLQLSGVSPVGHDGLRSLIPTFHNGSIAKPADEGSDQLISVLIQCFAIIFLGYLSGRLGFISPTECKGLNFFLGYVSLPSAIFFALATLDLESINVNVFISLLVSKAIVFIIVVVLTSIIGWPDGNGRAGLYGIFCTQSNDFALGFPIISALYGTTHPEFPDYIYLAVPISLGVLNPIGLIMLEFSKQSDSKPSNDLEKSFSQSDVPPVTPSRGSIILKVIINLFRTPIFFMTVLGLIVKVTFAKSLPLPMYGTIRISGGIVAATFFSAPMMLASSKFINSHSMSNLEELSAAIIVIRYKQLIQTGKLDDRYDLLGKFSYEKLSLIIGMSVITITIGLSLFIHFMRNKKRASRIENLHINQSMESNGNIVSLKDQILCDHFGICPRERAITQFYFSFYENMMRGNNEESMMVPELLQDLNIQRNGQDEPDVYCTNANGRMPQSSDRSVIRLCHGHYTESEAEKCEMRIHKYFNTNDVGNYNADESFELMTHAVFLIMSAIDVILVCYVGMSFLLQT
ncbi:Integral membrane protein GPR155 [Nymphon striatum]|nr:Integral membrane protein GPR155 [Nymphon striatum]